MWFSQSTKDTGEGGGIGPVQWQTTVFTVSTHSDCSVAQRFFTLANSYLQCKWIRSLFDIEQDHDWHSCICIACYLCCIAFIDMIKIYNMIKNFKQSRCKCHVNTKKKTPLYFNNSLIQYENVLFDLPPSSERSEGWITEYIKLLEMGTSAGWSLRGHGDIVTFWLRGS